MKALTQVVGGLVLAAAGAGIALLWDSHKSSGENPRQVTGDPPITLGDGSLHAHSKLNGWLKDQDVDMVKMMPQIIYPAPDSGSLQTSGCLYNGQPMLGESSGDTTSHATAAIFWADNVEPAWDISPTSANAPTIVTITQDDGSNPNGPGQQATITITVPSKGNISIQPQFPTQFDKDKNPNKPPHNREHEYRGEVVSIVISGSKHDGSWTPVNPNHPHYTLGFCYK